MTIFTARDGELRLYDATATPFFLKIVFYGMDLSAPENRPRPDPEIIRLANSIFIYKPIDLEPILSPLPISFSLRYEVTNRLKFRQALGLNLQSAAGVYTVGANTWVTTYRTTNVLDAAGATITRPTSLADVMKVCCNMEALWTNPDGTTMGRRWAECYFPPQNNTLNEQQEGIGLRASGLCYGAISTIASFTAGNAG